ncbi:hypothetical protein [Enterococcus florum]|uniref:hypothetical protein n=1 Tax=Enterococcus florum TaxID=2480627 RepID=UPI00158BD869|nr:hypothetical protein [Enterococcus florum]
MKGRYVSLFLIGIIAFLIVGLLLVRIYVHKDPTFDILLFSCICSILLGFVVEWRSNHS